VDPYNLYTLANEESRLIVAVYAADASRDRSLLSYEQALGLFDEFNMENLA
jgi:hypothetical protein